MYPVHFAGVVAHVDDPRETRNRVHLRALTADRTAHRRPSEPARSSVRIERIAFAGGFLSPSADFGPACCAA
jgi:hypothetical protein